MTLWNAMMRGTESLGCIMPIYRVLESELGQLRIKELRRSARRTVGMLLATLVACAFGLIVLDSTGEPLRIGILRGIWNAANLLTTLGDFKQLNLSQEAFLVFAMFAFISIAGYAISKLAGLVSSEAVLNHRENRLVQRSLANLKDHVVVIGFGSLGQLVAAQLRDAGRTVVVVERDADFASNASSKGYDVVEGDAGAGEGVLQHASIANASALVLTIEEADRKLAITLIAHSQNPSLQIIATGPNSQRAHLLKRAGASEVVIAEEIIAGALVGHLVG